MNTKYLGRILLTLGVSPYAYGQSHQLPLEPVSGADAAVIMPVEKPVEATRIPRRDTRSKLVCSSADAAPKLMDRTADGSCRSHTKEHSNQAHDSQIPWKSRTDINAITGR
ncbi:MAG: hypothetical protein EOP10_00715 [Proteobacteria bacterium]|nr:MAG: hypothetical protein EOP10_00715 [Pseudomonadota bacterium]